MGDPTNAAAVPTGTCADVFATYANIVLEDQPIEDFAWAENPYYTPYTDDWYKIYPYYNYGYRNYGDLTPKKEEKKDDKKQTDSSGNDDDDDDD